MEMVVAEASSELSRSSFIREAGSTSTWPEPRARTAVAGRGWIPMLDFSRPLFFFRGWCALASVGPLPGGGFAIGMGRPGFV